MIKTRFAPSPTGKLHLGNIRTALFNYLYAKKYDGQFLLRIEDTDSIRSNNENVQYIFKALKWLNLDWDGSVIYQTNNSQMHIDIAKQLLNNNQAYLCYSSQEEIAQAREKSAGKYSPFQSPWREVKTNKVPHDRKPVIRLKLSTNKNITIKDQTKGTTTINTDHMEDIILIRSDGSATYNLAVVVDDHNMGITDIIRGDDHFTNTAKQIYIYEALGWKIPSFAHLPLVHDLNNKKISKRDQDSEIMHFYSQGFLSQAVCNYLLRLGWSKGNQDIINMTQAISMFSYEGIGKSSAKFDISKLISLNKYYMRTITVDVMYQQLLQLVVDNNKYTLVKPQIMNAILSKKIIALIKDKSDNLNDLLSIFTIYLESTDISYNSIILEKIGKLINNDIKIITTILNFILSIVDISTINQELRKFTEEHNIQFKTLIQIIRMILTGQTVSPSIVDLIKFLSKNTIKIRFNKCLIMIKNI